ncbi:translation initiation factor 2 beta subunit (eIF-2beta)/eIF-5 [Breznakia sp. PF5-3]|uniref:hypothetical protein n=1 Tax=unclassified Breznakia TaxID=2623764 RepID=UPI0024052F04|nr:MULTISPECIES: hypothetical protein [unclassified Breznakia]MDF9825303.1 translation initiation factor 2 beta subunit (eIF-2beta)/eIF-5 [Breznakia sp. PM6-1]MDF9836214.1 translation initiation factor 2 beta subunit (eIF-2beta)/eIF-5 [Breznakia sp. PF5-3]MDF9838443.1 translation initiation factor 2 beta subunit (eIF-2beta)/eIF-5 [Breznakia sp. PFB2-8]MDF9860459.1 translation initiation factor 2 beta subunit (eIF-2beta)/eIF-5 [Breznakia sp. PH5-24]
MKFAIRIVCSIILFFSSLLFVGSLTAQKVMGDDLTSLAYQRIEVGTHLADVLQPLSLVAGEENQAAYVALTNKIKEDEEINQLIDEYKELFVSDLLYDEVESSIDKKAINEKSKINDDSIYF